MAKIEQVRGNTFRLLTRSMSIAFYRLNDHDIILMDTAYPAEGDEIEAVLEEHGYQVKAILTTHVHYDHVGNHDRLRKKYGAAVYMTPFDAGISESLITLQACFYVDTVTDLGKNYPFMVCNVDHILPRGAESVCVEGAEFRILDLPGHAQHHIGFITPDDVAFVGDLLISEDNLKYMPMLFGHCWTAALESIEKICKTDCKAYILAHNAVVEDIRPLAELNRKVILDQMEEVASCMQDWISREDVNAIMVQRKARRITEERVRFITRLTNASMNYLADVGRLECEAREAKLYYRALAEKKENIQ